MFTMIRLFPVAWVIISIIFILVYIILKPAHHSYSFFITSDGTKIPTLDGCMSSCEGLELPEECSSSNSFYICTRICKGTYKQQTCRSALSDIQDTQQHVRKNILKPIRPEWFE